MKKKENWKENLVDDINLLGHRNWIVVTDMAYPLQSQPGIETIYTDENYESVLNTVCNIVNHAPHVKALIYQDDEINYMREEDAEGIEALREKCKEIFENKVSYIPHEKLIAKLDEIAKTFNVVILKTNLTIPYTTTFFELDCKYWSDEKQKALDKRMGK